MQKRCHWASVFYFAFCEGGEQMELSGKSTSVASCLCLAELVPPCHCSCLGCCFHPLFSADSTLLLLPNGVRAGVTGQGVLARSVAPGLWPFSGQLPLDCGCCSTLGALDWRLLSLPCMSLSFSVHLQLFYILWGFLTASGFLWIFQHGCVIIDKNFLHYFRVRWGKEGKEALHFVLSWLSWFSLLIFCSVSSYSWQTLFILF